MITDLDSRPDDLTLEVDLAGITDCSFELDLHPAPGPNFKLESSA